MKKLSLTAVLLASMMATSVFAEEPWTEVRVYLFATEISGDVQIADVTADVDASFSDILDQLDMGFMGMVEHRRDKWSFIGDIAYLRVTDEQSNTINPGPGPGLEIGLEAELAQTVIEGFAGYRFHENNGEGADLGIDVLFGARHTTLDIDLDLELPIAGSVSRDREEDWVDAVIAVRFENDYHNGWGSSVWLDVGDGSDSSSYQALALVNYSS